MDKFETQFSDLDVQTNYMEETMSNTTAVSTPQDQVDSLMKQMAEEANIELAHDLESKDVQSLPDVAAKERSLVGEEDAMLADRLRALRPAT
jgi:charged multivesicular body protein 1